MRRTSDRKALRSIMLNAFSTSIVTSTLSLSPAFLDIHWRATCTDASAPPGVPTPSCTGSNSSRMAGATVEAKALAVSRRIASPTAMGRWPPDGLGTAVREAPHNHPRTSAGTSPLAMRFAIAARWRRTSSRKPGAIASLICWGRRPLGPPADAGEKPWRAFSRASSSMWMAAAAAATRRPARRSAS